MPREVKLVDGNCTEAHWVSGHHSSCLSIKTYYTPIQICSGIDKMLSVFILGNCFVTYCGNCSAINHNSSLENCLKFAEIPSQRG